MADEINNLQAMRLAYVACRGEGENACVIGPKDAIVVEITHGDADEQLDLARKIAAMLNSDRVLVPYEPLTCADRPATAQHLLLLVERNSISDNEAIETLGNAIDDAGGAFARNRVDAMLNGEFPF